MGHRLTVRILQAAWLGLMLVFAHGFRSILEAESWEQIVAAAKREGTVVIYGPAGAQTREAFSEGFQKKYPGIRVEYTGGKNVDLIPKLVSEAKAGLNLTDLHLGGADGSLTSLMPQRLLAPVQPFLVGPDSSAVSKWRGGKFEFADEAGKFVLVPALLAQPVFAYNPKTMHPAEIKSWKDLLNPKWKDQIGMWDPRASGAGLAMAAFAYYTKGLGPDYLRLLLAQGITFVAAPNQRQGLEWIANGKKLMYIGPSTSIGVGLIEKGAPIAYYSAAKTMEGSWVTPGATAVTVVEGAPHPNAAKVYLDWLLSKDGQIAVGRATMVASLRLDVPADHMDPNLTPQDGARYVQDYKELYNKKKSTEVVEFVTKVIAASGK